MSLWLFYGIHIGSNTQIMHQHCISVALLLYQHCKFCNKTYQWCIMTISMLYQHWINAASTLQIFQLHCTTVIQPTVICRTLIPQKFHKSHLPKTLVLLILLLFVSLSPNLTFFLMLRFQPTQHWVCRMCFTISKLALVNKEHLTNGHIPGRTETVIRKPLSV